MQAIDAVRSGGKIIGVSGFGAPLQFDIDTLRERSLLYLFPDISTLEHLEHINESFRDYGKQSAGTSENSAQARSPMRLARAAAWITTCNAGQPTRASPVRRSHCFVHTADILMVGKALSLCPRGMCWWWMVRAKRTPRFGAA
jgi:hypothetical protein